MRLELRFGTILLKTALIVVCVCVCVFHESFCLGTLLHVAYFTAHS